MKKYALILKISFGLALIAAGVIIFAITLHDYHAAMQERQVLEEEYQKISLASINLNDNENTLGDLISDDNSYNSYDDFEDDSEVDISSELQILGIINIEKINLSYVVVEGTDKKSLSKSIGHFEGTAMPGETGNLCLAGHRGGKYGKLFKNLDKLEIGDEMKVSDIYGNTFIYEVSEMLTVEADDVYVLEATTDKTITLVTCNDNGKRRLIVRGAIRE